MSLVPFAWILTPSLRPWFVFIPCLNCLEEHALRTGRQGQFLCPDCQAQVNIPEGNCFDNLPTGFLQNSLLSLLAVRQSRDGVRSAVVIVTKRAPRSAIALLAKSEITKFFCLECQICVCQVCVNTDHKLHNVDPLEKAADAERANITAAVESIEQKKKVCNDAVKTFQQVVLELERNITVAKRKVSQTAEQMIAKVREHEREATKILENIRVSRMTEINSLNEQVKSLIKQLDQAVQFAKSLVERSSSSDVLKSKQSLEQRFGDLNKVTVPSLPVSSFVKYFSTNALDNLNLGSVIINKTDVYGCHQ